MNKGDNKVIDWFLLNISHLSFLLSSDIVTCMTLDKSGTGEHLVTGSRDTTCVVWKFKNDVIRLMS